MLQGWFSFKAIKLTGLGGLALAATGCASFGPKQPPPANVDVALIEELKAVKAGLESQVASLQFDNARLERRVMELEREKPPTPAAIGAGPAQELKDPPTPTVSARRPERTETVVAAVNPAGSVAEEGAPIARAPRLVQPSFASNGQTFENEASGEIRLQSVLWGVHLASYRRPDEARAGWRKLQRENPDELGLLEPRIERTVIPERGEFLRLVGGGFASREKAADLCALLSARGLYCSVANFQGERLSLAEAG